MKRPTLFVLSVLIAAAGCDDPPVTPTRPDLAMPDLRPPADLGVPDLLPEEDMAVAPDLMPLCGHGQEFVNGACTCDARNPITCPGATHCCAVVQMCLPDSRCSAPIARQRHALAYDTVRQRTVVFGGLAALNIRLNDLWEEGRTWSPLSPAGPPAAREGHSMIFDGNLRKVLIFGGRLANNTVLNEMITWDGTMYAPLSPATRPTARDQHAMAYDSVRRQVVLFGGTTQDNNSQKDTWEWNGTAWLQRMTAVTPIEREGHGMVYDVKRQRVVLFGGFRAGSTYADDTWEWNGSTWTQIMTVPAKTPRGRAYFAMAYDPVRERTVAFSGEILGSSAIQDTWEYDGTGWTQRVSASQPPGRVNHAMVYDPARGGVVIYGGVVNRMGLLTVAEDMWLWNGNDWSQLY